MKTVLRATGVPCARHKLAVSAADALEFAERVGFPLVVKPPAGAGAKSTFRLDDAADLRAWLDTVPPTPGRPAQMEEFLTGDEGSYDSVMVDGQVRLGFGLELPAHPARGAAQPVDAVGGAAAARHRRPRVRRHQAGRAAGAEGARAQHRAHPHGVVSAARTDRWPCPRSARARPAPRSPRCSALRTTSTCTPRGPGS